MVGDIKGVHSIDATNTVRLGLEHFGSWRNTLSLSGAGHSTISSRAEVLPKTDSASVLDLEWRFGRSPLI